jgi:hypothetical protein
MSYRIVSDVDAAGGLVSVAGSDLVRGFGVYTMPAEERRVTVYVGISQMHALAFCSVKTGGQRVVDEARLARALSVYEIPRIEIWLRDGSLLERIGASLQFVDIIKDEEVERLFGSIDRKTCRYLQHGEDDECVAGLVKGEKVRIATTPYLCLGCKMPDRRIACSMLHHVSTHAPEGQGIQPNGALCAAGMKSEFDPHDCRPGENECWQRWVEPEARSGVVAVSPLALHEAVGYLDAVWRNAFGRGLLARDALLAGGVLAAPCATSQDFKEKVSAVVDAFNALHVPIDTRDGSLQKILLHLQDWARERRIPDADLAPVERAISVLKRVPRLRAGFEHAAARADFEAAQQALGVSLPAESYADEWNRLVARISLNLGVVRQFIRSHIQDEEPRP